ncbi:MAG: glycosyltransferase family 2 protein [Parvularculaceae bacterium]
MQTLIVIPCLNEARLIAHTAGSLGFGGETAPYPNTRLLLVDNGSADGTWAALSLVRDRSPAGAVLVAHEAERGYVPPRHRGALIAAEIAAKERIAPDNLLILQGDGDTIYEPGYVSAMRDAARASGPGHMLQARTQSPRRFLQDHPGFQQLADQVDQELAPFAVDPADDIVVDDKVAGYRLGDYLRWGGHRRDYMSTGAEVHGETTRLFIRARQLEARKLEVDSAWALPSRRKIQRNPVRHFVTAGFPREEAWWRAWNARYRGPNTLAAFDDPTEREKLALAIAMRRAHLMALFTRIPRLLAQSLGRRVAIDAGVPAKDATALAHLEADELGLFFELLLPRADET